MNTAPEGQHEKRPTVNIWFIAYGWFLVAYLLLFAAWCIRDGWVPSQAVLELHPETTDGFCMFNRVLSLVMIMMTAGAAIPVVLVQIRKRARWVWIVGIVYLSLSLGICLPLGIPVLVFWVLDPNREYYCSIETAS
jgi:hypothetical protein